MTQNVIRVKLTSLIFVSGSSFTIAKFMIVYKSCGEYIIWVRTEL